MSEHEFRSGMRLAVADEPPMTFDIDELMITAERLVRRRRALMAVGTGTAMVAVAAVAVPVVLGISRGPAEIPQAAPPTAVSSTATTLPPSTSQVPKAEKRTKAQLTERGREMQAYLRTKFPQVVAGATAVDPGVFGGEAEGKVEDDQKYLTAFVKFTLGTKSAVDVHVQLPGADQSGMGRDCATCQQLRQPDGSTLVIEQVDPGEGNNAEMKILSATHFRLDGSVTRATAYNYDPTGQQKLTYAPAPALTVAQLTALATDPALHA